MKINKEILNESYEGSDSKKHTILESDKKYILIYFYPADDTPLCTIQGRNYTKLLDEFHKLDCEIIGVSAGSGLSKHEFACDQNYKHLLLADNNYKLSKEFDVYTKEGLPKYPDLKIFRCTFIINHNGEVIREQRYVDANDDAEKNLMYLKSIN